MRQRSPRRPLGRKPPALSAHQQLLVFVEGDTEEQYLKHWSRLHRDTVRLEVDPERGCAPMTLVRYAAERRRQEQYDKNHGRGRPHDQIWCVFDCDDHPRISTARETARENNILLAFSNPCIEL